jgi:3-deoxy-D-manno-octulosonic-acid transferase
MKRSIALGLYLLASRGGPAAGGVFDPRPPGPVVWLRGSTAEPATPALLARQIAADFADITPLVSPRSGAASGFVTVDAPPESLPALRAFLDHWRPDVVVLLGSELPPALVVECHDRGIPTVWADAQPAPGGSRLWGGLRQGLLQRLSAILARDSDSAQALRSLGGEPPPVTVVGRIEPSAEPLPCLEAERQGMTELLGTRPVWLAMACPQAEEEAVIAAHARALRLAHRMLLVFVPDDASRTAAVASRMAQEGWSVAQRSLEEEADPEIEVLVTDGQTELGLWYRLAPACYMGGSLTPGAETRNPFEAAALGSAIVCGPNVGSHAAAYARLSEARALRRVGNADALADAVVDLIAPDRAAVLAHNAWSASSSGAAVTERVAEVVASFLDSARPKVSR